MNSSFLLATRQSALATTQSQTIAQWLTQLGCPTSLYPVVTTGDRMQTGALSQVQIPPSPDCDGARKSWNTGKGLFVKEIQQALLGHKAHLAVHSMKDLPVEPCLPLEVVVVSERAPSRDVLVLSPGWRSQFPPNALPNPWEEMISILKGCVQNQNPRVGTISARRSVYLTEILGSGAQLEPLRGNVDTRLAKVKAGEWGAIVLAEAGLHRLRLLDPNTQIPLPPEACLPPAAQGIVCVESRTDGAHWPVLLANQNLPATRCALWERLALFLLGGDCQMAIASHWDGNQLHLMCARQGSLARAQFVPSSSQKGFVENIAQLQDKSFTKKFEMLQASQVAKQMVDFLKFHGFHEVTPLVLPREILL
jgi:hydroxymethylbilane synthase